MPVAFDTDHSPGRAPCLVDALNVAYWAGSPPSLRLPLAVAAGLLGTGAEVVLYFDASARHRLAADAQVYDRLRRWPAFCVEVPAGRDADKALLREARKRGAVIVSRDRFHDWRRSFRKLIDDPARIVGGVVRDGRIVLPALALELPLDDSAAQACDRLAPWLEAAAN